MDQFEKPYRSQLQVELWVCTRSPKAVQLADREPGSTRIVDEEYDDDPPSFDDEDELICTAIIRHGTVFYSKTPGERWPEAQD